MWQEISYADFSWNIQFCKKMLGVYASYRLKLVGDIPPTLWINYLGRSFNLVLITLWRPNSCKLLLICIDCFGSLCIVIPKGFHLLMADAVHCYLWNFLFSRLAQWFIINASNHFGDVVVWIYIIIFWKFITTF